ncbi:MAG TPA: DUF3788 family protein [Candidatus Limnocylindrales bacterium]|jgi:hypothetical protein
MTGDTRNGPPPPSSADFLDLLGPAGALWSELQEEIRAACPAVTERWVYGGRKYGWSCRLERGNKGILYMTPDAGHFRIGLALPDAARDAALAADLPAPIREELAATTKVMEGWPVRLAVRTRAEVAIALRLAEIKLAS